MKLSPFSEHALLSLIAFARLPAFSSRTVGDLTAQMQIPRQPLQEILDALARSGYLQKAGRAYRLSKPANTISVAEIIRLFDGILAPFELVEGGHPTLRAGCTSILDDDQKLSALFSELQETAIDRLEKAMISDLA